MAKYMIEGQISIFDKPKIKLIEDCTSIHPLLIKDSIQDVFIEQYIQYISLISSKEISVE